MLKSLIGTGLSARLTPEKYEEYKKELAILDSTWRESLTRKLYPHLSVGIKEERIPVPYNQKQYPNIVFDYRGCFNKGLGSTFEEPSEPYKTMAIGGTILCAMATVYETLNNGKTEFKNREELLIDIGKTLVNNNYRTKSSGTRWIALDKVLEMKYGIETKIQCSKFEAVDSICRCHPVISLVPTSWVHNDSSLTSNEAVIIWAIRKDVAIITTTTSDDVKKVNVDALFHQAPRTWACHKILHA